MKNHDSLTYLQKCDWKYYSFPFKKLYHLKLLRAKISKKKFQPIRRYPRLNPVPKVQPFSNSTAPGSEVRSKFETIFRRRKNFESHAADARIDGSAFDFGADVARSYWDDGDYLFGLSVLHCGNRGSFRRFDRGFSWLETPGFRREKV